MADTSRLRQGPALGHNSGATVGAAGDHTIREGYLTRGEAVGPAVEVARQRDPVVQAPPIPVQRLSNPVADARPVVAAPVVVGAPLPAAPLAAASAAQAVSAAPAASLRVTRTRAPVAFRHDGPPAAFEGTTISDTAARIAAAGGRQRSVVLIRVRVPAGLAGPGQHDFELRALILANGRDVIRYTVYRDPTAAKGFGPRGPCGVAIELREVQVLAANADRPAEAQIRYEGTVRLPNASARFAGLVLMDGGGLVRAVDPSVNGAGAIGRIQDGTIEITWP